MRARDGGLLSDSRVWHVYALAGGLVGAMQVEASRGWRVWRQDDGGNRHGSGLQ
ncbi:MAG TPA: hypothetical protein VGL23_13515 [Chloroflexota bacterium]